MSLKPIHYSVKKRRTFAPAGMSNMKIPDDTRTFIEGECLDIYTKMVNSGASLQTTLAAIFLSGMNAAQEAMK